MGIVFGDGCSDGDGGEDGVGGDVSAMGIGKGGAVCEAMREGSVTRTELDEEKGHSCRDGAIA